MVISGSWLRSIRASSDKPAPSQSTAVIPLEQYKFARLLAVRIVEMSKVLWIDEGCDDPLEIPIIVEDGPANREKRLVVDARDLNAIKVEPNASPLLLFREIQSIGDVDHWRGK